jgi:alpha-1,2-mannosyltransferase
MRGALKASQVTSALSLNAAAGLLISPISWSHHWVWAAPALLTCLSTASPDRRRLLTFAVPALLTFAIGPHWLLPSGGSRELHWAWWQQVAGDSYALIGLAVLTQAAIKNLLPRPGTPGSEPRRQAASTTRSRSWTATIQDPGQRDRAGVRPARGAKPRG